MNRSVAAGIIVLLVVASAVAGAPVTAAAGTAAPDSDPSGAHHSVTAQPQTQSQLPTETVAATQDFDRTTFEITVHRNGSATWTFEHERRFDGENESEEREAFESFAEEFESEETELYERFTTLADSLVDTGTDRTDREMEATNFNRSARVEDQLGTRRGVVEMSFTWEGFAATDDGTVTVGDVFEEIYLGEDQSMVIRAGEGLTFDRIEPAGEADYAGGSIEEADEVVWRGEQQFLDSQPRAVLTTGSEESSMWQFAVGGLLLLAVGAAAAWYGRRRWTDGGSGSGGDPEPAGPARANDAAGAAGAGAGTGSAAGAATAAAGDDAEESAAADPLPDDELLTDEDRVVKLIRENGGRMKQVNIVEETGWSKSKVSMLLSDMEEDGTISKLRVGRENIISLEGFEPEATKSPFED